MNRFTQHLTALLAVFLLAACSNSTGASSLITASEGGSVTAGTHTVSIPAAALGVDTEVVLQTGNLSDYGPLAGAREQVLELLPAGTVLETPATVTVGADLIAAESGSIIRIHQFRNVDGESFWTPMEFSLRSGGAADVPVTVFAPLGIVVESAATTSSIEGFLRWGGTGDPVGGATLELWQGETMLDSTTTDDLGAYRFEGLEPGTYTIQGNPECTVNEEVVVPAANTVLRDITVCG